MTQIFNVLGNEYDLLILGRTARAWATHPAVQVETEQLANRAI